MNLGTWNARSLISGREQEELLLVLDNKQILMLQEMRRDLKKQMKPGFQIASQGKIFD